MLQGNTTKQKSIIIFDDEDIEEDPPAFAFKRKRSSLVAPATEIYQEPKDNTGKQNVASDFGQGSNSAFVSVAEFEIFKKEVRQQLAAQANSQFEMMKQLDAIEELLKEFIAKQPCF
ncbi:hypothetical protein TSUD_273160 [Trifolium subterraneum]|uniref:Uncharacterized protein n=1 Tax=Trifolium subterraneum TaxID=3900 RepID=A0A2Z6LTY1_TRISU|nr:hypothetical protein TSUD_273160 [Trifolium subterraneum]